MILGSIVGDVAGNAFDMGYNVKTASFELFSEHSEYSDDTVMTLAVASALQEALEDDQPLSFTLVRTMKSLGREYGDAGYGSRFKQWLESKVMLERPYRSHGNGAAMRVSCTIERKLMFNKVASMVQMSRKGII